MAFPMVEYYARNNWAKHGLKRIMMDSKGFFFFKFDSRAGLEAVLEGGLWLIRKSPIILKKWSMDTRLLKEELTRISIWADLVVVVTIGIPSLSGDDFTKEIIRVEYEWRPPRCDICKIFGHVHDYCLKKVMTPHSVTTSNVITSTVEKTNDGFQTVGKKKKMKGKSKFTNANKFTGLSVKHNTTGNSSKKDNLSISNFFFAFNDEEEDVDILHDESANLNTKAGGSSSFTAAAEEDVEILHDESANLNTKAGGSSSFTAAAG
ncbi:zinc knuckle CX2CX4HX4C containing protein [Tanacetum coccineum]|uniref:Zinc knuckle CX2CX4HX4C containing protein n=1 Tax=Tanacetum coccineum TaxID=301880 RepID=A0ABQ5D170_9ASTR